MITVVEIIKPMFVIAMYLCGHYVCIYNPLYIYIVFIAHFFIHGKCILLNYKLSDGRLYVVYVILMTGTK